MKKIITHSGAFHADELLAIALIQHVYVDEYEIIRKSGWEITEDEFNDPNVWIVDVGERHQPLLNNYDHHQDKNKELLGSNWLVLEEFVSRNMPYYQAVVLEPFFRRVAAIDVSAIKQRDIVPTEFNRLIRNYPNFKTALEFAVTTVEHMLTLAGEIKETLDILPTLTHYANGSILYNPASNPLKGWKEFGDAGIRFMIHPDSRKTTEFSVGLTTRDSEIWPIPDLKGEQGQIKCVNNFFAVYADFDSALAHAKHILQDYRQIG
jgi:hypothetical protein